MLTELVPGPPVPVRTLAQPRAVVETASNDTQHTGRRHRDGRSTDPTTTEIVPLTHMPSAKRRDRKPAARTTPGKDRRAIARRRSRNPGNTTLLAMPSRPVVVSPRPRVEPAV